LACGLSSEQLCKCKCSIIDMFHEAFLLPPRQKQTQTATLLLLPRETNLAVPSDLHNSRVELLALPHHCVTASPLELTDVLSN
jgi:hypothetical protein